MKRLVSMLMVAAVIFSVLTVSANENNHLELLTKLGIVQSDSEIYFEPKDFITAGEFSVFMGNIHHANQFAIYQTEEALEYAYQTDMFAADANIRKHNNLTYNQALEMACRFLGYGELLANSNRTPLAYANRIGLTDGLKNMRGKYITKGDAMILIRNVLSSSVMEFYGNEEEKTYYEGETVLEVYRNIRVEEGVVEALPYSSLYSEVSNIGEGRVTIGTNTYLDGGYDFSGLLGVKVRAFILESETAVEEIYAWELMETVSQVVINAEDVIGYNPATYQLSYYINTNSQRIARLDANTAVIVNGVSTPLYTADDFLFPEGNIVLINNDGDSTYDTVQITKYETMLTAYYSNTTQKLVNKYTYPDALGSISLDPDDCDVSIQKDGVPFDAENIKENDILSIAISQNGKKAELLISDKQVSGIVSAYQSRDNKITLGGKEYMLSDAYLKAVAANDSATDELSVGADVTIYLDTFGKVAMVKKEEDARYGYALKLASDGIFSQSVVLRLLNAQGNWEDLTFADKVYFKGILEPCETVYNTMNAGGFQPQLVRYKLDADGKIRRIDLARETLDWGSSDFTKTPSITEEYRGNSMTFDSEYFLGPDNKIWFIPETDTDNEELYQVSNAGSLISDWPPYTFSAYDVDEYGFSDVFVVKSATDILDLTRKKGQMFMVNWEEERHNDEGELVAAISGIMFNYNNITAMFAPDVRVPNLQSGDILTFRTNQKGEIVDYDHVFSMKAGKNPVMPTAKHTSVAYFKGDVARIAVSENKLAVRCGTSTQTIKMSDSLPVILYDGIQRNAAFTRGSVQDIEVGDFVVIRYEYSRATGIVVYK